MSAPIIDKETSVLSYPQWLRWEHQFSATEMPTLWKITAGGFPEGMTFQPSWNVTADASLDTIALAAHGFPANMPISFSSLTGGTGLSTTLLYFVVNPTTDAFQLALTPGGAAVDVLTNYTAGIALRPGFLSGAANTPGVTTVRLIANNGTDSTEQLFTIGIEPAAAAPDSNVDAVWDFATNNIVVQTSSTLDLTPADRATPIISVKEGDDLIIRLRMVKNGSVIAPELGETGEFKLFIKEFEPDPKVVVSDDFAQAGSGDGRSYLLHAKLTGEVLASVLSNYENDKGTFYPALAELEMTFGNTQPVGPEMIVRTSKTFTIQIERNLGAS